MDSKEVFTGYDAECRGISVFLCSIVYLSFYGSSLMCRALPVLDISFSLSQDEGLWLLNWYLC